MLRAAITGIVLTAICLATSGAARAQWGWEPWDDDRDWPSSSYSEPFPGDDFWDDDYWDDDERARRPVPQRKARSFRSGGPRPAIAPITPRQVRFPSSYPVGSIVIDHKGRQLFLIQSPTAALRYPISVGRRGFSWTGTERVSKIVNWPDWYPPASMRRRDPSLPKHMSGGLRNPLGAKALYLGKTLYRIHGTNNPKSIGRAASSGCFRMLNGHIIDLASRVRVGTRVTVVRRLPRALERTVAEQVTLGKTTRAAPAARASRMATAKTRPATSPETPRPPEPAAVAADAVEEEAVEGPAGEGAGAREPSRRQRG